MRGLMQDWKLLIHKVIDYAATEHPGRAVVSRLTEGPMHRTTYGDVRRRALRVAKRLQKDGIEAGDRVATLAWNNHRHLESWYGIAGIGAIYHTVNPRLFADQIVYIVNHAEDRILLLDLTFVPLIEKLAAQLPTIERYVILTDAAHMPQTSLRGAIAYEDWIGEVDDDFRWLDVAETDAAGLCYTSGTTGEPKGVLYSHRSNVLHAMMTVMPDAFGLSTKEVVMPVVPLFHANSWSLAFAAPMAGSALVMPGPKLDGASVYDILETEKVTFTAAVPTIWFALLQHMEQNNLRLTHLKRVGIGGSACPPAVIEAFETKYGVEVLHAWGMTEMSPVGSICSIKPEAASERYEELLAVKSTQGYAPFGVEWKITDDLGKEQPRDGKTFGRLKVRGTAVARRYFKREDENILDEEGYFDTGDVATLDENGYMRITDRSKDVIKSGGEWISSIDLENLAVGHPAVAEAAVIGVAHPKWDERPLLIVVAKPGAAPEREDVLDFLRPRIAKWWMPDDVVVVEELPHTATGKLLKTELRRRFADYRLPGT
ncbi:long-chain-fatty-acid--CoA ligase [Enterovirga rhinocerotis]|uniref:3-methylmercaptopropionyl-CoA ligase n=1 Tax=Enterovirga rhinocerotis TaxID=1339210 RepID=A0A4R7C8H3_9HYPH|nr:long-chain-fatty-acid--CoA ligase [Enterovirga rhinocerotis]TDR94543.1 fatty-acyl-CoA synthase [Enterovirga rhinocerotis]